MEDYNLASLTTLQYLDYIRIKLIQLDHHIMSLYKNPVVKDELGPKTKLKFKIFFNEVSDIVDETLFLEHRLDLTDSEALKNLETAFFELMSKARDIVSDVRVILDQI